LNGDKTLTVSLNQLFDKTSDKCFQLFKLLYLQQFTLVYLWTSAAKPGATMET